MTPRSFGRRLFATALAVLLSPAVLGAPPASPSPWTTVPVFPTGCYSSRDDFATKIAAAQDAMSREIARQEQINEQLKARLGEGLGKGHDREMAFAKAAQMSQMMMKDPQAAAKMMQQTQSAGTATQATMLRDPENRQKLDMELKNLLTQYNAALGKAVAPVNAKINEFMERKGVRVGWSDLLRMTGSATDAETLSLLKQWNTEREKACAEWWQASGPFHAWFKRYRDYLIQDHIPWQEQNDQAALGFVALATDSTSVPYKSTATMKAVADYMKRAAEVFGNRPDGPMVTGPNR